MNLTLQLIIHAALLLCGVGYGIYALRAAFRHKRKPSSKGRIGISDLLCGALSICLALICGGYGLWLIGTYALPDDDFADTGIYIDGRIYQDERFTADGVTYVALPLESEYYACDARKTAVFCYRPDGFWNGHLAGNYYRIENSAGFDLIWNGLDRLFAPEDQIDQITAHYYRTGQWYVADAEAVDEVGDPLRRPLSQEAIAALQDYPTLDLSVLPTSTAIVGSGEYTVSLGADDPDGLIFIDHWFVLIEGEAYVHLSSATNDKDQEEMTLAKLPAVYGQVLWPLVQ